MPFGFLQGRGAVRVCSVNQLACALVEAQAATTTYKHLLGALIHEEARVIFYARADRGLWCFLAVHGRRSALEPCYCHVPTLARRLPRSFVLGPSSCRRSRSCPPSKLMPWRKST